MMQWTRVIQIPQLAVTAAFSSSAASHRLLKVGDVLKQSRRFTDADLVGYSVVSGDQNPIHLDANFSRQIAGFDRGRIVHGLLIASLFPSLIASHFPGAVYASQSLHFKLPVYIEDEVVAEVQATNIRAIKEKYYIKWTTKCYTKCGPVCDYRCSEISHKKPCLFFCNMCCAKCLCIPSGTYGHKEECPCYKNWKTQVTVTQLLRQLTWHKGSIKRRGCHLGPTLPSANRSRLKTNPLFWLHEAPPIVTESQSSYFGLLHRMLKMMLIVLWTDFGLRKEFKPDSFKYDTVIVLLLHLS